MRTYLLPIALATTACLSKPAVPLDGGIGDEQTVTGDGGVDAPDGAEVGCGTRIPIPEDFRVRTSAVVGDIIRAPGGEKDADDLVIWGRRGASADGEAMVYIIAGGPGFNPQCADRAFPFLHPTQTEPTEAYVGPLTNDSDPDLLFVGRYNDGTDDHQEIYFYRGDPLTGAPVTTPMIREIITAPDAIGNCNYGGTIVNPYPVYLTSSTGSADAFAEVVFGGLNCAIYVLPIADGNPGVPVPMTSDAGPVIDSPDMDVQDVFVHGFSDPTQLVITTQSQLIRIARNRVTGSNAYYDVKNVTQLAVRAPRPMRTYREGISIDTREVTIGITTNVNGPGFEVVQVIGIDTEATQTNTFMVPGFDRVEKTKTVDLGFLDPNGIDAVVLGDVGSGPFLRVYRDLTIPLTSAETIVSMPAIQVGVTAATNSFYVGDFLGRGPNHDQVLVFDSFPGMSAPVCLEVMNTCLVRCGTTQCEN